MVSPLSSRIMNAEAKANINGASKYRPLTANVIGEWQRRAQKRVSGYTADRSEGESPPASLYSLDKEMGAKEMRAQQVESLAKRRRTEEANFQAFNVKNDLSKAGLNLPVLRSRALLRGSVNMDSVKLIRVTKESPHSLEELLDPQPASTCSSARDRLQHDIEVHDYSDLLKQAQQFYTSKGYIPTPSEEALSNERSSTISSSGTPSPPEDCSSDTESIGCAQKIPIKLATIEEEKDTDDHESEDNHDYYSYITRAMDCCARETLEDAIVSYDSARLIVDNNKSLTIIYGNGAFSQLTGLSSETFLGKPIMKVFEASSQEEKSSTLTLAGSKNKMTVDVDADADDASGQNSISSFAFSVSPIKSNERVTHFVIRFAAAASSSSFSEIRVDSVASGFPTNSALNAIG